MLIYPAIDIRGGKYVRLLQGKPQNETIYGHDPVEMAESWAKQGAKRLHVVDLDGAFGESFDNMKILKSIVCSANIPIQFGGGLRSIEKIKAVFDMGVYRVILGTAAIEQPSLIEQAVQLFGERIAISVDARNGRVAVKGWVQDSGVAAVELVERMKEIGIKTIIYTDISKDGMLTGPNLDTTAEMVNISGMDVIASGGISCVGDLRKLKAIKVSGAIIGKALYNGNITLEDALMMEEEKC